MMSQPGIDAKPSGPTPLEPRYFPRVALEIDVHLSAGGASWVGKSINVSEGGIALVVDAPVARGTLLQIAFDLPDGGRVEAKGRAVRVSAPTEQGSQVAIVFEDLVDRDDAAIARFVADHGDMAWEGGGAHIPREIALKFIPLIRRVARSLAARLPAHVLVDDLVGAGFVALVEVWAASPHVAEADLERIAVPRVRYAMLDELRESDPLSRRMRGKTKLVARTRRDLESTLGRAPTRIELAEAAGMTHRAIDEVEELARTSSAVGHESIEDHDMADASSASPEDLATRSQSIQRLHVALEALPPRHRQILDLYYGEELTLRQIGNIVGVTEARISQLVADAVRRLKENC